MAEDAFIRVHVFDVGFGDSILLEFPENKWGVIDCNYGFNSPNNDPPVLSYLKSKNVNNLEFICLTHPHLDHFQGLWKVCKYYSEEGRTYKYFLDLTLSFIDIAKINYRGNSFASNELYKLHNYSHELIKKSYKERYKSQIIIWRPIYSDFRPKPFLDLYNILCFYAAPNPVVVNEIKEKMKNGDPFSPNKVCMAIFLQINEDKNKSSIILLSGDLEKAEWEKAFDELRVQRHMTLIPCDFVKVGHHGGTSANPEWLWSRITHRKNGERKSFAVISTSGQEGHPSPDVLNAILSNKVILFCTRKGPQCIPLDDPLPKKSYFENNIIELMRESKKERKKKEQAIRMIKKVMQMKKKLNRECSGNISFEIKSLGEVAVIHQDRAISCLYMDQVWNP